MTYDFEVFLDRDNQWRSRSCCKVWNCLFGLPHKQVYHGRSKQLWLADKAKMLPQYHNTIVLVLHTVIWIEMFMSPNIQTSSHCPSQHGSSCGSCKFMQGATPVLWLRVVDLSVPVVPVYPSETRGTDQPSVDSSLSPVAPNRPSLA